MLISLSKYALASFLPPYSCALMTSRETSNDALWWMFGLHETEKYNTF
jgi:hypothetical protein